MKINDIETSRLLLRGFTKEDALWAYSIWNNPEMGQYLPDEAKEEIDDEYLKMLEGLGEDDECCYLIPVFKDSLERVGTCSFMISEDKKVYDIAYCVHKKFWCQGYATEIAQGMIDYARGKGAGKRCFKPSCSEMWWKNCQRKYIQKKRNRYYHERLQI